MKELDIKRMFAYQLLKKDSTDVIFFEYPFHFGRRRADIICVEDGMIVGYEIKSAFDRIDRLKDQLESYTQLFDFVYVICDSKHISAVRKITPARIGIYECTLRGIKRIRKASQIKNFDSITTLDAIPMDSLRKQFKTSGKSKLEICHKISNTQKRSDIKSSFRKHIIHKYSDQTSHFKSEFSDVITLDDVYALSLAPNKLGT